MAVNFAPGANENMGLVQALIAMKAGGGAETSSDLEKEIQKMMVMKGLQNSSNDAPVGHWTQGLSRLTGALVTKQMLDRMVGDEKKKNAAVDNVMGGIVGGGAQPSPVPVTPPAAPQGGLVGGLLSSLKDIVPLAGIGGGDQAAPQMAAQAAAAPQVAAAPPVAPPEAMPAPQGQPGGQLLKSLLASGPMAEQPAEMTGGNTGNGIDRSRIAQEIQQNPGLVKRFADMINGEVTLRDPKAATIQAESAADRALARNIPLSQALMSVADDPKRGYYASDTYKRPANPQQMAMFEKEILPKVLGGSEEGMNTLGFRPTGNASQLGFAQRRADAGMYDAYKWPSGIPGKGEMYALEKGDGARMAKNLKGNFPPELLSPQSDAEKAMSFAPTQMASSDGMVPQSAQPGVGSFAPSTLPDVKTMRVKPTGPGVAAPQVAQAPTMQNQPTPQVGAPSVPPNIAAAYRQLMQAGARKEAMALVAPYLKPVTPEYAPLGDDAILNKHDGTVRPANITKKTNDIREYELYSQQEKAAGREPMPFMDYATKLKQAGSSKVSIDQRGETKYDEFNSKSFAELNHEIPKAASQARSKIATLDRLGQILADPNISTGAGAGLVLDAKRYAKTIGIDVGDLSGPEAVRAIQNQFALELRNPSGGAGMPGAMSDKDREFLQSIPPGLERTPEGNKVIGGYLKKVANRSLEIERLRQSYVKRHGRLNDGFYQELADFSDANPLFPEAAPGNGPAPPQSGSRSIDDLLKKYGGQK